MTIRAQRFRPAATIAFMLELLSLLSGLGAREGFGLVAQGQPDCTITVQQGESIQGVIDVAQEDAVICLAIGAYQENLKIKKSLTLRGLSTDSKDVWIIGVRENYPVIRIESDSEIKVMIEKLTAAGAKGEGDRCNEPQWICPSGVEALGKAKVPLREAHVSGNRLDGLLVLDSASVTLTGSTISDNERYGLGIVDSASVALTRSTISGNRRAGLLLERSARVISIGSTVSNNLWDGLYVEDSAQATLMNNTIQNNKQCGIRFSSNKPVQGEKNRMSGNGVDLCGNLSARLRLPLEPEDLTKTELSFPGTYPTLQQAVDALAPGGTITIAAGEHPGGVTIWKPLKLKGVGREQTKLVGAASLINEAQGVEIEGVTITGSALESLLAGGQAQAVIADSTVSDNCRFAISCAGLWVSGSASVTLTDSTISGSGYGLFVWESASVSLTNSTVSSNGQSGLYVSDSARVEVRSSVIAGNGTDEDCKKKDEICVGINVSGKSQMTITESKIINNADWGVAASLKRCGYLWDYFTTGKVSIDKKTVVEGNNRTGNHTGNPGWQGPPLPDGQVCLP